MEFLSEKANGEEWILSLENLSGVNEITARFTATEANVLNSELSAPVSIVTTNVKLQLQPGTTNVTAILRDADVNLKYSFVFTWYNGDTQVGNPTDYGTKQFTSATAQQRGSKPSSANKVTVTATIYDLQGNVTDVLTQTTTLP